jgi:hypothetical protein
MIVVFIVAPLDFVETFEGDDCIICDQSPGDKRALGLRNDAIKQRA